MGGGGGTAGGRGPRVGSAPAERSNDGVERNGIAGDLPLGPGPGPDRAWTRGTPEAARLCFLCGRVAVLVIANA